jgi:TolB-like protein/Tfp pilus assembly protein PilF
LWADGTYVDFDHSISSSVNKLRAALSDSAATPRYVETVGRQGYRFIYPVTSHLAPLRVVGDTPLPASRPGPTRRPGLALALVAAVVLATAGGVLLYQRRAQSSSSEIRSIAVLPLKNLSSDPEQEYFSEGLTDELITRLASLRGLRVISRTSVMQYKDSTKPLPQVAAELHVDAVVEGSVLRSGSRIRITAQLIEAASDRHLWAHSYERDQRDVLALQDEVARDIADNIQLSLTAPDRERLATAHPIDPQAHEYYLRALHHWARRNPDDIHIAIGYFEQAIARQPDYALAYAGLAHCYALLGGYTGTSPEPYIARARAAALKALELDDRLAPAHTALAVIAQDYDWDWQTAESEYRQAIRLDPNDVTAHHWYAEFLSFQGRFDEAFAEIDRAEQFDPLSSIIQTDHAAILYYARQYDRAAAVLRTVLARDPGFGRAHGILLQVLVAQGKTKEALADLTAFAAAPPVKGSSWLFSISAHIYALTGDRHKQEEQIAALQRLGRTQHFDAHQMFYAYADAEHKDLALAALERAYREHSSELTGLKANPIYDPFRSDPRFQALLHRMNFAP